MARPVLLAGVLLVALTTGGARGEEATDLRGTVAGQYVQDWDWCDSVDLRLVGQFSFGGRMYRGAVRIDNWLDNPKDSDCSASPFVRFFGGNSVAGPYVSGTCTGGYDFKPLFGFQALLNCSGRVTSARGPGPLGRMILRVDALAVDTPTPCWFFPCGPGGPPSEMGSIAGKFFRG